MATPICIIAPISSWAAAVTGFVEGEDGSMRTHELNALKGDLYTTEDRPYANAENEANENAKGTVVDLIVLEVIKNNNGTIEE